MVIWKYPLKITYRQKVRMPKWAEILSVGNQNDELCLWVMCQPSGMDDMRVIEIIGTGNPISNGERKFIGTVAMKQSIWHVFERKM